jgi:hypothetical protein
MLKASVFLGLMLAISATDAFAQNRRAGDNEYKACSRDVSRFCRKVMNDGDMVVLNCLQENRTKLTRSCKKVLEENGQ